MNQSARKIGLMGGTFDPIHFGHLFIAEAARVACDLERVVFFPNNQPAHAQGKVATLDAETRLELVRLSTKDNPHFEVSLIEIEREGPSFAFDTIREFQHHFGANAELFFIVGADSINEILTWYRGEELFELCRFVAASRPGFSLEEARKTLSTKQIKRVIWLEVPGLHIASRDLRRRLREGLPIRYLVPDEVAKRMEDLNLKE